MYHGMETKENYCSVIQGYEGILVKCLSLLLEFWNLYFHTLFMQKFWDSNKILKEYIYKHTNVYSIIKEIQSDNWLNKLEGNFKIF